jgi:hypothetical protein
MPQSTLVKSSRRAGTNGLVGRALLILSTACVLSSPLAAQSGPVLRDCNQHQYEPETLVSLVELLGKEITRLVDSDAELRRLVQQGAGQDLTNQIYSAGLLQRVPDCTEPVVHVQTGNQVPGSADRAAPGAFGFTIVVKAMPKPHCEAMKRSQQFQRPFAVRFEPPGNRSNWRLGACASNPIPGILALGRTLPQPNTAYLFFPVRLSLPAARANPLCDLTALLARVKDPEKKRVIEDLFLRMVGALSELSEYRRAFLSKGIRSGLVDLFPAVYYHMTRLELERIKNNEYRYPDVKLRQIIAFYDAYKRNREAYEKGRPVEKHWGRHFQKVADVQKSLLRLLNPHVAENGVQEVIDTGMWAHIIFDFPRALRSAFDSLGGQGPSWNDLQPDFKATETMFPTAMEKSIEDISAPGGWGRIVSWYLRIGSGFAFVTEKVRLVLPDNDNLALDPTAVTVEYIKAVRDLAWLRAREGPPWPWTLERQFESNPKEMRAKGESFCALSPG